MPGGNGSRTQAHGPRRTRPSRPRCRLFLIGTACFYGAPRVHQELKAKTRRGFRPCRNPGNRANGVAENLLQQKFSPAAPNRCWAGDITYIRTTAGWRYLAVWIDFYSRRVVGWAMGATMEAALVLEALNRAPGHRLIEADQLLILPTGSCWRASSPPSSRRLLRSYNTNWTLMTMQRH